jgi:hypothetical protein
VLSVLLTYRWVSVAGVDPQVVQTAFLVKYRITLRGSLAGNFRMSYLVFQFSFERREDWRKQLPVQRNT